MAGRHLNQFLNLSSFAEQMVVHEHALVKMRRDMPLDLASLIGCSVVTGYGAVVHTARIEPGATVAVFGAGGIGLATINAAQIAGAARIVAIDKDPFKLDLARSFGATDVVDANEGDTVKRIVELTGGGVQYSFECIGLKATAEQSFSALRSGGTATLIGMIPVGTKIELHGVDFLRERRIQGCMMGSNRFRTDMPQADRVLPARPAAPGRDGVGTHRPGADQRGLRRTQGRRRRAQRHRLRQLAS